MGLLKTIAKATGFSGYDAAESSTKRRPAPRTLVNEDERLKGKEKRRLISSTRDLRRNFSVARWAINKHLDFVVAHNFRSKSGDKPFDRRLERFVETLSRKENFDVTKRHPRRRYMRMLEAGRVVDGDIYSVKIAGRYLQAVEGDRCDDPPANKKSKAAKWVQGLQINASGEVTNYAFHKRVKSRLEFERTVKANRVIPFGYYDRFDQYRGVSPLAAAVNTLKDLYEGFDLALAKAKVSQLFALAIYREAEVGFWGEDDLAGDDDCADGTDREVDFGKSGPKFLDLDPGERAEFLESKSPAAETVNFWQNLLSVSLKCLGIPMSFYDESFTTFFGSKSALIQYLHGVTDSRLDVRDHNDDWLCWRLAEAIATGEFEAPVGYTCDPSLWEWIPKGVPWWDAKDIKADGEAVSQTFKTRSEVRRERVGDDWFDVVDRLKEENEYLAAAGLSEADLAPDLPEVEIADDGKK